MLASMQFVGTVVFGIVMVPFGWLTPNLRDFGFFMLAGGLAVFASLCVNRSLKLAPASVVVPYQYSMILWAAIFGYLVFGDLPSLATIIGVAIIIATGLYIFLRERELGLGEPVVSPRRCEGVVHPPARREGEDSSHLSRLVELLQFFSDDQTLRVRRKQSTGVEEPSASKRCNSTPLHWKPHFSRMLREEGLATRAPEQR
jgi:uncharacterized membrane protein